METFKIRLSDLMFTENLTSKQLGDIIGTDGSTISRWKEGKQSIKLSNAVAIADYFKCSLEFLFGRSDKIIDFELQPIMSFYERLREIMQAKRITRYRMGIDLKKSHGHFDYWKRGGDLYMQTVIDLANYLDVTIDYLVGRDRTKQ